MKTITTLIISLSTLMTFIGTYFYNLTIDYAEQYLALVAVVLTDGFFGIIAGIKKEGFQTKKAIKVLRTLVTWVILLTVLLITEKGFPGTSWLSETILIPFIIFQIISAIKNASMAGFISSDVLNKILDAYDKHKGERKK